MEEHSYNSSEPPEGGTSLALNTCLTDRYMKVFKAILAKPELTQHDRLFLKTMTKCLTYIPNNTYCEHTTLSTLSTTATGRAILDELRNEDISLKAKIDLYL